MSSDTYRDLRRAAINGAALDGNYERLLLDLLAIIHRDGGHYTTLAGLTTSIEDAERIVLALFQDNAALKARLKKLTHG